MMWTLVTRYVFHYRVDDGLTYLCMADEDSRRRIPFAFLQEIKNRFQATYGDRCGESFSDPLIFRRTVPSPRGAHAAPFFPYSYRDIISRGQQDRDCHAMLCRTIPRCYLLQPSDSVVLRDVSMETSGRPQQVPTPLLRHYPKKVRLDPRQTF